MSRPPKMTYGTTTWRSYNQALKRRGRQQTYSDAAIQTCLTLKVLLGLPLRQATGFVASLLELSGLGWSTPDFSTLSRRQKTLDVTIPFRGSNGALHLPIDSTGIKVEGTWHTPEHGGSKRRVRRKIHLGIDEETLKVRAGGVTTSNVGDAPGLPDLLAQFPADEEIATVTADCAYDTRLPRCHCGPRLGGNHPAETECEAMEAGPGRGPDPGNVEAPRPGALTELERVPSPQQGQDENALF